jgi:thioredoxin reductase
VCGNGTVERAIIFHNKTQEELELPVDAVILNLGFVATLGPIKNWGLELQGNQIVVDEYMQTNLPGVYAAGDVCTHAGKLKLIATGVGEVCYRRQPRQEHHRPHCQDVPWTQQRHGVARVVSLCPRAPCTRSAWV